MNIHKKIKLVLYQLILIGFNSCVEEIPLINSQSNQNSFLIVQAELTDSLTIQRVLLSRSALLNSDEFSFEQNASVTVEDSNQTTYVFNEINPGEYLSAQPFKAEAGISYQLKINTESDQNYISNPEVLNGTARIDRLYAERVINDNGTEGVGIFIDSADPNLLAANYRFAFEETFKVIAPFWNAFDAIVISTSPPEVGIKARENEEQVCYQTRLSTSIILGSTQDLEGNSLNKFMVTFLPRTDYAISHRYSILIEQRLVSLEHYSYYQTLKDLSNSESIFTDTQPGFLTSNIKTPTNSDERVIGLFEVNSIKVKRLFFDYDDLFSGEELPPYAINCGLSAPPLTTPGGRSPLIESIISGRTKYFAMNEDQITDGGPFLMTARACGDCTALGTNQIPAFWVE